MILLVLLLSITFSPIAKASVFTSTHVYILSPVVTGKSQDLLVIDRKTGIEKKIKNVGKGIRKFVVHEETNRGFLLGSSLFVLDLKTHRIIKTLFEDDHVMDMVIHERVGYVILWGIRSFSRLNLDDLSLLPPLVCQGYELPKCLMFYKGIGVFITSGPGLYLMDPKIQIEPVVRFIGEYIHSITLDKNYVYLLMDSTKLLMIYDLEKECRSGEIRVPEGSFKLVCYKDTGFLLSRNKSLTILDLLMGCFVVKIELPFVPLSLDIYDSIGYILSENDCVWVCKVCPFAFMTNYGVSPGPIHLTDTHIYGGIERCLRLYPTEATVKQMTAAILCEYVFFNVHQVISSGAVGVPNPYIDTISYQELACYVEGLSPEKTYYALSTLYNPQLFLKTKEGKKAFKQIHLYACQLAYIRDEECSDVLSFLIQQKDPLTLSMVEDIWAKNGPRKLTWIESWVLSFFLPEDEDENGELLDPR